MNKIEKVSIKNSKGELASVIHYPSESNHKLVVLTPGYLDTKDYAHMIGLAEDLSNIGYTVVRYDPYGTWESGGLISDYTVAQQLEDLKSIVDLFYNKFNQVILGGHSRGGMVSILAAIQDSRISRVMGIMPPYILIRTIHLNKVEAWKRDGFRLSKRDLPGQTGLREYKVPYANLEEDAKYNLLDKVQKLHVPIILIAGEMDDVVEPSDVKAIFIKANEPKRFTLLEDIEHGYRHNPSHIKLVNQEIINFLK